MPLNNQDFSHCLVGHFLTDRSINFAAMGHTIVPIWRPVKGVHAIGQVKEIRDNLYIFQFFHERDIHRALNDGPWSFSNHTLIIKRLLRIRVK